MESNYKLKKEIMFTKNELTNQLTKLRTNVLEAIKGHLTDGDEIEVEDTDTFISDCYGNTIDLTTILLEDDTLRLTGITNINHENGTANEGYIRGSDVLDVHELFLLLSIVNQEEDQNA